MATYRLFGLTLASDFPFVSRLILIKNNDVPDFTFSCALGESSPGSQQGVPPTYVSPLRIKDGESIFYLYRQPTFDVLRFSRVADFYLWPKRIVCNLLDPAYEYLVEIYLVGTVLSFWLERQGIPALHASAVVANDRVVAFLGTNTGGKSSLAATLLQAGYLLLTDDILAVERGRDMFIGRPGYPQIRLWPDQAEYFLGHHQNLQLVHPGGSKRRVPVGPDGLGAFCDMPKPLSCFYLPDRRDLQEGTIEITPVSRRDAVIELVRHSFLARIVAAMGLQSQRLDFFAQLVRHIPMRRVLYPSGSEYLPCVRERILEDLQALI